MGNKVFSFVINFNVLANIVSTISHKDNNYLFIKGKKNFDIALDYIKKLPTSSRFGVYVAYHYYQGLFNKIKRTPASQIALQRIRIPNTRKITMLGRLWIVNQLGAV